jgi:cytidylate kinase
VAAGHGGAIDQISAELAGRDDRDRARAMAPLVAAEDAHHIDTSSLSADEVVNRMFLVVTAKL